jgi:hypothetical protein
MKSISSIQELIKVHTVDDRSIQYLIKHPAELAELIKKDFMLAAEFFDYFQKNPDYINEIVTNARKINSDNYVLPYTFIKELIDIIILMSTATYFENPIHQRNLPDLKENNPFVDLGNDLVFSHLSIFGRYSHVYSYRFYDGLTVATTQSIQNDNSANVEYDPDDQDKLVQAQYDCLSRKYVMKEVSLIIIRFLSKLTLNNTLDYEFSAKWIKKNESIQRLVEYRHFDVIAALLKCVSPEVAIQLLQLETCKAGNPRVLHVMLTNHEDNREILIPAAKQAIACMQALKNKDQLAFETFIDDPKGFDLLKALRAISIDLAKECYNIHPEFMKIRFKGSSEGLEASNTPAPALATKSTSSSSSSSVSASNLVTPSYKPPVVTPAAAAQNASLCRIM